MDIDDIISVGHIFLDLADCFQERQGFDISHSTADFGNNNIRIVIFADTENTVFNFIGDMGITCMVDPKYSPFLSLLITDW